MNSSIPSTTQQQQQQQQMLNNTSPEQRAFVAQMISSIQQQQVNLEEQNNIQLKELKDTKLNYDKIRERLEERYTTELVQERYTDAFITLAIMQDIQTKELMKFNVAIDAGIAKLKSKNVDRTEIDKCFAKKSDTDSLKYNSEKYQRIFACSEPAGLLDTCESPNSIPVYIGMSTCCKPFSKFMVDHHKILQTNFDALDNAGARQRFKANHAYYNTKEDTKSLPQYMHVYFLHRYLPENMAAYFTSNLKIFQKSTDSKMIGQRATHYVTWHTDLVPGTHYYRRLLLIATYSQFIRFLTLMFMEVYTFHREKFQNLINATNLKEYQKTNPIEMFSTILKTIIFMVTNTMDTLQLHIPPPLEYPEGPSDLEALAKDPIFQKQILHKIIQDEIIYIDAMDQYERRIYGVTALNRLFRDIPDKATQTQFITFFSDMFQQCIALLEPSWDITHAMLERYFTCIITSDVFEVSQLIQQTSLQPIIKNITNDNQGLLSSFKEVQDHLKLLDKEDERIRQNIDARAAQAKHQQHSLSKALYDIRENQKVIDQTEKDIEKTLLQTKARELNAKQLHDQAVELEQETKTILSHVPTTRAIQKQKIDKMINRIGHAQNLAVQTVAARQPRRLSH